MKKNKIIKISLLVIITLFSPYKAIAQNNIFDQNSNKSFKQFVSEIKAPANTKNVQVSTNAVVDNQIIHFWEDLKTDVFDDICKNAEIKLNQDARIDNIGGLEGKFKRYLKQYPDQRIALIDEVGMKIDTNIGQEVLNVPDYGSLNVNLGAIIEGNSIVVRPLDSIKYCKELDTLIDLRKVKTILPINSERINKMKIGEIWKLPLTTRVSFSAGMGAPTIPYINIYIGAGISKERTPSITLFRMNDNTLRLRIRINRITVKSVSLGVTSTYEIAPSDIGLFKAENILTKLVNKEIAKQINKSLAARLNYSHSKINGNKILIEFLINPNNKEQLDALVEFLKGDFGIIKKFIKLGLKFNEFKEDANFTEGINNMNNVVNEAEEALKVDASFAGANHYHGHSDNLDITVPVIHSHQSSWNTYYNRYQTKDNNQVLHINSVGKVSNGSTLNIPFVGTIHKYNSDKNVMVINKENENNEATSPSLIYQHNIGFVRQNESTARYIIQSVNNVLKYIGMKGEGTSQENLLPIDNIFPESVKPENYDEINNFSEKSYKSSLVSFKLMFSKEGIQEILYSTSESILKAYLNVMGEAERYLLNKVGHLFVINEKGVVSYDRSKAENILGIFSSNSDSYNPLDTMRDMAYTATCLIKDIFSVKTETDWKKQSEKLSSISAGKGKSKMGFEDFFKVIVQLVSKENVSSEIYVHTDKRVKGEEDINQTYTYSSNKENNVSTSLAEVNSIRDKFSDPSMLSD